MLKTIPIINKAVEGPKEKYNILTFDTHERYQTQLCKTGHNFYSFKYKDCKDWDTAYAPKPDNYYTLPVDTIPHGLSMDMVLSQSKFGQFQVGSQIAATLGLPLISLEHTLPIPNWPPQQLEAFKNMIGHENVFISEYSVGRWGMNFGCPTSVVHHSVDSETFKPKEVDKKVDILSVVNEFVDRDYCCNYQGWLRIASQFEGKKIDVVGKDSEKITQDIPAVDGGVANGVEDLVERYNSAKIFLNTSTISPVPTSLLEAMACGCAIVTTSTCMIPEIIENGVNGYSSNDEKELASYINTLLENEDLRKSMGQRARETVVEKFSEELFNSNWNRIFDKVYGVI